MGVLDLVAELVDSVADSVVDVVVESVNSVVELVNPVVVANSVALPCTAAFLRRRRRLTFQAKKCSNGPKTALTGYPVWTGFPVAHSRRFVARGSYRLRFLNSDKNSLSCLLSPPVLFRPPWGF